MTFIHTAYKNGWIVKFPTIGSMSCHRPIKYMIKKEENWNPKRRKITEQGVKFGGMKIKYKNDRCHML